MARDSNPVFNNCGEGAALIIFAALYARARRREIFVSVTLHCNGVTPRCNAVTQAKTPYQQAVTSLRQAETAI